MFPANPRRMYDPYRYNWQQENSSRGMASAIEVPLRDATPSVVPSLHFPHNYYGSSPPALPDITTQSDESIVSEMVGFSKIKFSESGLWTFEQNPEQNNDESSPPALLDIKTQRDERKVSFSKMTWGMFAFWLLLKN